MKNVGLFLIPFFLIRINTFSQLAKSIDLENGLIVHFPFDGNLHNISENLSETMGDEPSYVSNLLNKDSSAISLKNDIIKVDFYNGKYSHEYSISFWLKPDTDLNEKTSFPNPIKFLDSGSPYEQCFMLSYFKGNIKLNLMFPHAPADSGRLESNSISYPFNFNKNRWYFFNISFGENNSVDLTIDDKTYQIGTIKALKLNLGRLGDLNKPLIIGGDAEASEGRGKNYFNGAIDDLRIYTRILQEDELAFLYKKKTEIFPIPIVLWRQPFSLYTEVSINSFNIKHCIKTESAITKIQIFNNDVLLSEVLNPTKYSNQNLGCDYIVENEVSLEHGSNYIKIAAFDEHEGVKYSEERLVINKLIRAVGNNDYTPPILNLVNPNGLPGFKIYTKKSELAINGNTTDENGIYNIKINGITAEYDKATGSFKANVLLNTGDNTIKVVATDINQNQTNFIFFVNREKEETAASKDIEIVDLHEKRIALLIGNADYENSTKLKNPLNDTNAMAEELLKLGFEIKLIPNGKRIEIIEAISQFGTDLAQEKNTTGLFYYAGHGMQVKGKSYIVPIDAKIEKELDVISHCIDLESLMANMEEAANNMNLIILDACRNNPFSRSFRSTAGNGLATIASQPKGSFIAFATSPGMVAADGEGNNGLYTQEFLKALKTPKMKIEDIFKKVRVGVSQLSNEQQIPWENSSLMGDFYFRKK